MKKGLILVLVLLLISNLAYGMTEPNPIQQQESGKYSYTIIGTGQSKAFDNQHEIPKPSEDEAFYGQDAQYPSVKASYIENGDGTIIDKNTGLMWQKTPGEKISFNDAFSEASKLNLGGYSDWRVPTIKELYSLMNFDGVTGVKDEEFIPYIDTNYFDFQYGDTSAGERKIDAQYWSSTKYVSTTMMGDETVFGVNFADGRIKGYPVNKKTQTGVDVTKMFVRYVRGNPDYGKNNFVDNGDGTITDKATGLMWMKSDSGTLKAGDKGEGALNWEQALNWAENLDYAGYSDWKLPNAKELQSLVDYTRSPYTTNSAAIDPLFESTSIKDPSGNLNYPYYWTSTTHQEGPIKGSLAVYLSFGEAQGYMKFPPNIVKPALYDVHGAGAQRSDPKAGDPSEFPEGRGPQGDVISIYNYARCVRYADKKDGEVKPVSDNVNAGKGSQVSKSANGKESKSTPKKGNMTYKPASDFSVVLVGTGGPNPLEDRASSSTLIQYKGKYFLVDMGNGTQERLKELGVNEGKIETLMFTHHHQDHDEEYFGVLSKGWQEGRSHLNLIGTKGTKKLHDFYTDFYSKDLEYRASKKAAWSWDGMKTNVDIKEVSGNDAFSINGVDIKTTSVPHSIATQAYRFNADGKSIVVSGDLTYSENLIKLAKGADVLVIDSGSIEKQAASASSEQNNQRKANQNSQPNSTNRPGRSQLASGMQQNTKNQAGGGVQSSNRAHAALEEVAEMAQKAGVKKLVLTHIVGNIDEQAEKAAIAKIFKGEVIVGQDLMEIIP